MGDAISLQNRERADLAPVRGFANQAFSRAAEAPLIGGNRIRLLINARENYPAWLEAIRGAQRHDHFENYIIHEDDAGRMFAEALVAKAREGVRVRVIYDWTRLSAEKYDELSRAHLLDPVNRDPGRPVVWSHPAFANKCVYARNDKEIVCVSLAAPSSALP
ncbi:MAG: phosphatidylserine/phosphatidylglycerophosphate/cardiolipin synthase family protein [Verrucomicrobiia bacterium]